MKSLRHRMPAARARRLAVLSAAALLAGCSSDGGGDWMAMLRAARTSWEERDASVALQDAASIPYASLGIRIGGGREQILILAVDNKGERLWTSGAHVAVSTRHGRIVRTSGFGADLSGFVAVQGSESSWLEPHSYRWTADFSDLGQFSLPVNCDVRPAGRDPITILGKEFDTIRVEESCHADTIGWTYTNTYWVSAESGRVWRAIEHFHPKGPEVEIEILRPPLSSD